MALDAVHDITLGRREIVVTNLAAFMASSALTRSEKLSALRAEISRMQEIFDEGRVEGAAADRLISLIEAERMLLD